MKIHIIKKPLALFSLSLIAISFDTYAAQSDAIDGRRELSDTFPAPERISKLSQLKPHMGITSGISIPQHDYEVAMSFGFNIGFQPLIPFGLGLSLDHFETEKDANNQIELARTSILLNTTYNFSGDFPIIRHSYVGLGAGPVFDFTPDDESTYFGIAPILGFDVPMSSTRVSGNYLSVGAAVEYLTVLGDQANNFSANAQIKYWF